MTQNFSTDEDLSFLKDNLQEVLESIQNAAVKASRSPDSIRLMAVTKTVKPLYINYMLSNGVGLIGENKVQELLSKVEFFNKPVPEMHIIGHLQSNKVRKIIDTVDMIQSVDSISLAKEISRQAVLHEKSMDILLEVNIGSEDAKTGLDIRDLNETAFAVSEMEGINLKGLMCVPPMSDSESETRGYFEKTRRLYDELSSALKGKCEFSVLSMGMSGDYVHAIAEGANLVRVGSALFGARRY